VIVEQHIREGRFQRSLALVTAFSSLLGGLEVTLEHYRGSYSQQIMYTPVFLSLALTVAGTWAALSRWAARVLLPITSALLLLDGLVGFYFHVRGIARKPGGWRIPVMNVIMGPPLFAPLLLALSGYLGVIASLLRREDDPAVRLSGWPDGLTERVTPRRGIRAVLPRRLTREGVVFEHHVREGRFQKHLAVVAAITALIGGLEALYSHYKNNFRYPIEQWSPVALTPVMLAAGVGTIWSRTIARTLLPAASALALFDGTLGFYYHVRGALRRPGGIKLPFYNALYGPPLFVPLLLAASGAMGILASLLRRAD
jgi:small basic protein